MTSGLPESLFEDPLEGRIEALTPVQHTQNGQQAHLKRAS